MLVDLIMAKVCLHPRILMPLMFGLIIGFTLSLFCAPFQTCDRKSDRKFPSNFTQSQLDLIRSKLKYLQFNDEQLLHQQIDDFEPRINLQDKPKRPSKPTQKLQRPRYLSTELGIRKRIFVGVLASGRHLSPHVPLLNETLYKDASRLTFFVNNPEMNENNLLETTPAGISVVNFNDGKY